ncbi:hypothetical protein, partial [Streptomyces dysideae]|uniref:hypothetical protein n=1 Tax=Streptomyces dysideae TaxID=909626 RepID=UPI000A496B0C
MNEGALDAKYIPLISVAQAWDLTVQRLPDMECLSMRNTHKKCGKWRKHLCHTVFFIPARWLTSHGAMADLHAWPCIPPVPFR